MGGMGNGVRRGCGGWFGPHPQPLSPQGRGENGAETRWHHGLGSQGPELRRKAVMGDSLGGMGTGAGMTETPLSPGGRGAGGEGAAMTLRNLRNLSIPSGGHDED